MNVDLRREFPLQTFLSLFIGATLFFVITGGRILNPAYIDWLMEGDPATHWLGWQFFRHSPFFQWPMGANPDYGMAIGSSIVFTDSIPLFAFFFKALNPLLADTFQYFGLWLLVCFSLQSLFAWKLLSLITPDKWLPLIGCVFFSVAPVCLWRLHGHYALFGQWVVLAGLYFYFSKTFSISRWNALLVVTALIHAYLLAMVLVIYLADLVARYRLRQMTGIKALGYCFSSGLCLLMVMWAAGYFMVGHGYETGGFGIYRMNLLALIDPGDIWSNYHLGPMREANDYEGFNYFGLGMIALACVAAYEFLHGVKPNFETKIIPIALAAAGLVLLAISNRVIVGSQELFSYPLPWIVTPLINSFRVSARLFWPVYYLLYLAVFYLLFTRLKRHWAIVLCVAMLAVSAADSVAVWHHFRDKFGHAREWVSPMRSPAWRDIASRYRKLVYVLPQNKSPDWLPLSQFAATHRMVINTGYFARVDPLKEQEARSRLIASIIENQLSPDSLYVFADGPLWKLASSQVVASDRAGLIDGFRVVAPNLHDCDNCLTSVVADSAIAPGSDFEYTAPISFAEGGVGKKYQVFGWSASESWGVWSDGDYALLLLRLAKIPATDIDLSIDGHGFLSEKNPSQQIDVLINKVRIGSLTYGQESNGGVRTLRIPKSLVADNNGRLVIRLVARNAKSPAELGLSADPRRLGIGLVSLALKEVK